MALFREVVRLHRGPFLLALTGSSVYALLSVGGTIVLGHITDDLVVPAFEGDGITKRSAVTAGLAVLAVALGRSVGVVFRRFFGAMTSRRMQKTWFERLADHYTAQPMRFFHAQPTGKLLAHTDADAEAATFAMQPLPLTVGLVVLLVASSVQLAMIDPLLLLIGLVLFPALAAMNRAYTRRVEEPSARAQALVGDVSAIAHESFEGALVIKLLGLEEHETERIAAASDRLRTDRLRIGRLRGTFEPALDALPQLGTIALLLVGSYRVSHGAISTGDLVQAMALFGILTFPVRVAGFLLEEVPRSVVSRERLLDVLADDHTQEAAPVGARSRTPLPDGPLSLAVEGVSFAYGTGEPVLRGVDFTVAPGEIVALVGATGSGKSTLCNLVAGLVRPASGQVVVGGVPLADADPQSVRRSVALVFQETFLFSGHVRDNLVLDHDEVDDDRLRDVLGIAQGGFVYALPEGLDTPVGERGVTLSGGQRQRLALARALVRRPRLLLLDDATSAVDPLVESRILDALKHELATSTLVVAHRVATIRLADRVVFLDGGTIRAHGTHDELLATDPAYEALVRAYEAEQPE